MFFYQLENTYGIHTYLEKFSFVKAYDFIPLHSYIAIYAKKKFKTLCIVYISSLYIKINKINILKKKNFFLLNTTNYLRSLNKVLPTNIKTVLLKKIFDVDNFFF